MPRSKTSLLKYLPIIMLLIVVFNLFTTYNAHNREDQRRLDLAQQFQQDLDGIIKSAINPPYDVTTTILEPFNIGSLKAEGKNLKITFLRGSETYFGSSDDILVLDYSGYNVAGFAISKFSSTEGTYHIHAYQTVDYVVHLVFGEKVG